MKQKKPDYKGALLIIDMVYDFVNPKGRVFYQNNRAVLENINALIPLARKNGLLVIYIQHSHRAHKYDPKTLSGRKNCLQGTGGDTLDPSLPIDGDADYVIKKRRYSAFAHTDLDLILREHQIRKVVLCGTKTNNCIRSTVETAYHLEYDVYVVRDCVATDKKDINDLHLRDIHKYYGTVVDSEELFNFVGGQNHE